MAAREAALAEELEAALAGDLEAALAGDLEAALAGDLEAEPAAEEAPRSPMVASRSPVATQG